MHSSLYSGRKCTVEDSKKKGELQAILGENLLQM